MDWMSWKPWTVLALVLIAVFAIYSFAATQSHDADPIAAHPATPRTPALRVTAAPGVGEVHTEWLDMQSGTYKITAEKESNTIVLENYGTQPVLLQSVKREKASH